MGVDLGIKVGLEEMGVDLGFWVCLEEMRVDLGFWVCLEEIGDGVEVALEKKEVIWRCGLTSGDWPLVRRRDADIAVCEGVNLAKKKKKKRERDKLTEGCENVESREV